MVNGNSSGADIDWAEYSFINNSQQTQYLSITQASLIDVSKQNVRVAIGQIFPAVSTATAVAAPSTRANLLNIAARFGTKFETIPSFITTTNIAGINVSAVFGYTLQPNDVQSAMGN